MKDRSLGLVGGRWERAAQRSWDSAGAPWAWGAMGCSRGFCLEAYVREQGRPQSINGGGTLRCDEVRGLPEPRAGGGESAHEASWEWERHRQ